MGHLLVTSVQFRLLHFVLTEVIPHFSSSDHGVQELVIYSSSKHQAHEVFTTSQRVSKDQLLKCDHTRIDLSTLFMEMNFLSDHFPVLRGGFFLKNPLGTPRNRHVSLQIARKLYFYYYY